MILCLHKGPDAIQVLVDHIQGRVELILLSAVFLSLKTSCLQPPEEDVPKVVCSRVVLYLGQHEIKAQFQLDEELQVNRIFDEFAPEAVLLHLLQRGVDRVVRLQVFAQLVLDLLPQHCDLDQLVFGVLTVGVHLFELLPLCL